MTVYNLLYRSPNTYGSSGFSLLLYYSYRFRNLVTIGLATFVTMNNNVHAQMRQRDATIRWYWEAGCSAEPHTTVVAVQGFCQLVPNAENYLGYRVSCTSDGSGEGFIQYCRDTNCGECDLTLPFGSQQCIANSRELWGNSGVQVQCPTRGEGDIIVPEIQNLASNHVEINWFENAGCGNAPNNFDRSIVTLPQELCHVVPNSPNFGGYKVTCNPDTTGEISFCTDSTCAQCNIRTPFQSETCLDNPPQYGSASVALRCPGVPPAKVVPFVAAASSSGKRRMNDEY